MSDDDELDGLKSMTKEEFKQYEKFAEKLKSMTPDQFTEKLANMTQSEAVGAVMGIMSMKFAAQIEELTQRMDEAQRRIDVLAKYLTKHLEAASRGRAI